MSPLHNESLTFRNLLRYTTAIIIVLIFVAYVIFQARFIIEGPEIALTNNAPTVTSQRTVMLEGIARNIVRITLDGRQIYTDKYGNFKEALTLENGYTIATLQAEDRYGRTTKITKQFVHINDNPDTLSMNK